MLPKQISQPSFALAHTGERPWFEVFGLLPGQGVPDRSDVPALVNAARREAGLAPLSFPVFCKEVSATESGVVYRLESLTRHGK